MGDNQIRDRLHLLRACGLVSKLGHSTYQITPEGRAFLSFLPRMELAILTSDDSHQVPPTAPHQPALGIRETQEAEQIANELEQAARDTDEPKSEFVGPRSGSTWQPSYHERQSHQTGAAA